MADTAHASDDGTVIYCTPLVVAANNAVKPPIPAYNKWDNGVDAITAALAKHGLTVVPNPVVTSYSYTIDPITKLPTSTRVTKQISDVLHQLLNAATAIGSASTAAITPVAITPFQYALFGLRHRDLAAADGEIASGSLNVKSANSPTDVIPATFVIYNPSVKAKTIVIVITVGGVKITITIKW